ncbi:MAG: biotin--[acetyl-CoA-carboxylase] ligase [archaeon]
MSEPPFSVIHLRDGTLGKLVRLYHEVTSTNDLARTLAANNAPEGTTVVSEKQTTGRGRNGRPWFSPPGGLWASIILRPTDDGNIPLVPIACGVAAAKAIIDVADVKIGLKWPNDLCVRQRKLGGILVERSYTESTTGALIVGIGINVRNKSSDLPPDLATTAISLRDLGKDVDPLHLLREILGEMEIRYEPVGSRKTSDLLDEWRKLSSTLGRKVVVKSNRGSYCGIAVDIDSTGALMIERSDNSIVAVSSTEALEAKTDGIL